MKNKEILITSIILFSILLSNINCDKDTINEAPQKPTIVYPADNSTIDEIPGSIKWKCIDNENDKLTYEVFFGKDNPPTLAASDLTRTYYSDFTVESQETYYWKINVEDEFGNITEGDVWSFTMGNFPPEIPANPIPENNSIDQNPTLISWECIEPDDETLTYDIYFGTASDDLELLEQNYTENNYELTELTGNKKYYWRIIAKDSYGNEITGPLWNFTTDFFAAELIFPEENSDTAPWFPKFKWTGNNTEDLTYDLYLGTSSNPELLVSDLTNTSYHHLEQLIKEQTYYWKVVSKKTDGSTAESPVWSFTVFGDPQFSSFTDARDGNTYQTVTIGNQTWMAENLKYFVDGSKVLDDDPLNEDIYGRLYTWEQVMNGEEASNENPSGVQGIAPDGWHIPSDTEWFELLYFLGATFDDYAYFQDVTDKLREAGPEHWGEGNTATNESGFTALPGGYFYTVQDRYIYETAAFNTCYREYTNWKIFYETHPTVVRRWYSSNQYNSLRCVKD